MSEITYKVTDMNDVVCIDQCKDGYTANILKIEFGEGITVGQAGEIIAKLKEAISEFNLPCFVKDHPPASGFLAKYGLSFQVGDEVGIPRSSGEHSFFDVEGVSDERIDLWCNHGAYDAHLDLDLAFHIHYPNSVPRTINLGDIKLTKVKDRGFSDRDDDSDEEEIIPY